MLLEEWLLAKQASSAAPPAPIVSKQLYTWGTGYIGSLGLGDTLVRSSPTIIGSSSWVMVSAGYSNGVGVTATGALFTWG